MQLADTLKPRSGLRWLFGETIVIVLGVLVALSLDDIWTARQERNLELQRTLVPILTTSIALSAKD